MSTVHRNKRLQRIELPLSDRASDPRERWAHIPGLRLPGEWPPKYAKVTPVRLEDGGISMSEQVIRDRR